jgi:hypothetical protein
MPPPNAELDDLPSQRKKNYEPSCAEKSRMMQATQEELEDGEELGANDILLSHLLESGNG